LRLLQLLLQLAHARLLVLLLLLRLWRHSSTPACCQLLLQLRMGWHELLLMLLGKS
jgi:hypothetical protein